MASPGQKQSAQVVKNGNNDGELTYKRERISHVDLAAKKFSNQERKAHKRKWREEKLLAQMEKEREIRKEKEEKEKQAKLEEEKKMRCGRPYTVSIALPGSILENAQSTELRAYLAGQVARAASVFNVDEIIIFDETNKRGDDKNSFSGLKRGGEGNTQLFHLLQYMECPQYLRKSFFPVHADLKHAGLLNPLDIPHHLREADISDYREGVTLKKPGADVSYINVGLKKEVKVKMAIPAGKRVTVKMLEQTTEKKNLMGQVVSPNEPRELCGIYWGYTVRLADSLNEIFDSPFDEDYDLIIGTSERGNDIGSVELTKFKHALIVFGGLRGLEYSIESDDAISTKSPSELFQHYVNVCPRQGSRTIRTEEAILIAMAALSPKLTQANASETS